MTKTNEPVTMLRSIKDMIGYPIDALDGEIGRCDDFLLDDEHWTIRYLVADTRKWLAGRRVLISPYQFGNPDLATFRRHFPVNMTRQRIKGSPELDADAPVSRRYEMEMARYYEYYPYWVGTGVWGAGVALPMGAAAMGAAASPAVPDDLKPEDDGVDPGDSHLRSAGEVMGYHVSARDGEIGHVEDFIVETTSWTIRWLVVDTRNWLPGRKVIVSPDWFKTIDLGGKTIGVDLDQEPIKNAPEFRPHAAVNRDYEGELYDYYGRPTYW